MKLTVRQSLIATLAYADVFGYPLTQTELVRWLVFAPRVPSRVIRDAIPALNVQREDNGFLMFPGNKGSGRMRNLRERVSRQKWGIARTVGQKLCMIPTLTLVGVTGGLALDNASQGDDVDLFFIVEKGTLWISRFLTTALVEALGVRRRPADTTVRDKVCLNMFMTEDALAVPADERDIFTAHEVLQMRPLWERSGAYRRFLAANRWAERFLPNAWEDRIRMKNHESGMRGETHGFRTFAVVLLRCIEKPLKYLQVRYMKKRRTTEVIGDGVLRFHPRDVRSWIRREMGKRLRRYQIPLDKIFYGR